MATQEFPGGLAVRILGFNCHGPSSIPDGETEILQVMKHSKKKKKKKNQGYTYHDLEQSLNLSLCQV